MALSKARLQKVMGKILALLEREFALKYRDTKVQVSKGWGDNIHIIVVSPVFARLSWREREEQIWPILLKGLAEEELAHISLCMLQTQDEVPMSHEWK